MHGGTCPGKIARKNRCVLSETGTDAATKGNPGQKLAKKQIGRERNKTEILW
jgi:hypothetical protein